MRRKLASMETQLGEASTRVAALEEEAARLSEMVRRAESERDSLRQEGEGKEVLLRQAARSKEEEMRALEEQVRGLEGQVREGEERLRAAQEEVEERGSGEAGACRGGGGSEEISGRETSRSDASEGRKGSHGAASEREEGVSAREFDDGATSLLTPPSRVLSFFESEAASTSPRIMEPRLVSAPSLWLGVGRRVVSGVGCGVGFTVQG